MRWAKASERLPDNEQPPNKRFYTKWGEGDSDVLLKGQIIDVLESGFSNVEWLDESVPPPAPDGGRFKMPTDEKLIDFALVFNDGKIEPEKLADMVGMCMIVIDRLHENGDILLPTKWENKSLPDAL